MKNHTHILPFSLPLLPLLLSPPGSRDEEGMEGHRRDELFSHGFHSRGKEGEQVKRQSVVETPVLPPHPSIHLHLTDHVR